MDERDNGPVPGILSADDSQNSAANDNGKIFDSSAFTGVKDDASTNNSFGGDIQTVSLNSDCQEKQAKPKGPSPFVKWQTWAIISGAILACSVVAIAVILIISEGRVADANALARYDLASKDIDSAKEDFLKSYNELVDDSYGTSRTYGISPSDEQLLDAQKKCLGRFSVTNEDIEYVDTRKSAADLQSSGQSAVEASERLTRVVSGYRSAISAIEQCRDDVLEPVLSNFEITFGEMEEYSKKESVGFTYIYPTRTITIKNNGYDEIRSINLKVDLLDKNGLALNYRMVNAYNVNLKKGESITADIYGNKGSSSSYGTSLTEDQFEIEKDYTPKIHTIELSKPLDY
jgi:hypothetical protein